MKKFIFMLAVALVGLTAAVAQPIDTEDGYLDISTRIIKIDDTKYAEFHPSAKNVSIELEYTPLTGEVRFYYKCLKASYTPGEAMNTALAVFNDFKKENNYYSYTYKAQDKSSSRTVNKIQWITYVSQVIFTR